MKHADAMEGLRAQIDNGLRRESDLRKQIEQLEYSLSKALAEINETMAQVVACHISNSSQIDEESPVTLRRASRKIGVSAAWLRRECIAGRLPHLKAGAAHLVDLPLIRKLLLERARESTGCQVTPD